MILNDPDLEYLIGSNQNDLSFYDKAELNAFYKCAGMICSSITSTVFYAVIKLFKCYLKGFKNDLMVEMVVTDRQLFSFCDLLFNSTFNGLLFDFSSKKVFFKLLYKHKRALS